MNFQLFSQSLVYLKNSLASQKRVLEVLLNEFALPRSENPIVFHRFLVRVGIPLEVRSCSFSYQPPSRTLFFFLRCVIRYGRWIFTSYTYVGVVL